METLDLRWRAVNSSFESTAKRHRTRRLDERRYRPGAFCAAHVERCVGDEKMKCGGDPRRNEFQWLKTSLVGN